MHTLLQLQLILIMHRKMSLQLVYLLILLLVLQKKPGTPGFITKVGGLKVKCVERERQALLKFKQQVKDHHGLLSSWRSTEDCCLWRGVGCDNRTGHVTVLDLHVGEDDHSYLRGNISNSLFELQHLNYLDLSNNKFQESLPNSIGSLSELRYINLSNNMFFGTLSNQLVNLSKLQTLDLSFNTDVFFKNINCFSHLSSLKHLDLSFNDLSKATDWLQGVNYLPQLRTLRLSKCFLSVTIPQSLSFTNSSKLILHLDLSFNHLQIIPSFIRNMCHLHKLNLGANNLNGPLSESIQNLHGCLENSLETLSLRKNQLSGSLHEIARFSSLKKLDLSQNQLSGSFPKIFTQLSKLVFLNLAENEMTGTIPESIMRSLSNLRHLDLSLNSLQGVMHEAHFSNLSKLKTLDLSFNSLSLQFQTNWSPPFQMKTLTLGSCNLGPHFPKWLQTQSKLLQLDISRASIADTIPDWFWSVSSNLAFLNLSHNQMSGKLPNDLSSSYAPWVGFDFSSNNFEGPLPLFPSNTALLDLSNNMFSGSISFICKIEDGFLSFLDLSNNLLSGGLPDCFMQFKELVVLNLGNNNFSGEIPSSLGSLSSLQTLSLRNNSLYRELPSFKNCSILEFLDLSENRLSGEIPAWIGESLSSLIFLSLESNDFSGSIPSYLCQLTNIQILDLSQNNLSGPIPNCLKNLTAMVEKSDKIIQSTFMAPSKSKLSRENYYINKAFVEWKGRQDEYERSLGLLRIIDFSGNKLRGEIPEEVGDLLQLMALNLSSNDFTGVIPQKIGQLKQLESLDLSGNQLSGAIPGTMADLNFLSLLDLSYNNLSGSIPTSTQLQSLDASAFIGNLALCGLPLMQTCPVDGHQGPPTTAENQEEGDDFRKWFYIGMVAGFCACFLGVLGALLLKLSWRSSYFRFLDESWDWFYVTIVVCKASLQRKHKS